MDLYSAFRSEDTEVLAEPMVIELDILSHETGVHLRCLLCSVLEGYNGTIFAYGQVRISYYGFL